MATWEDVKTVPVLYKENVSINGLEGDLYLTRYADGTNALAIGRESEGWLEPISINLTGYAMYPLHDTIYIPDYSEHKGTYAALVEAGVVAETVDDNVVFGPFATTAYEIRLV